MLGFVPQTPLTNYYDCQREKLDPRLFQKSRGSEPGAFLYIK